MMDGRILARAGKTLGAVLGVVGIALLTGCQCPQTASGEPAPAKTRPRKTMTDGCPTVMMQGGQTMVSQAFPTGEERTSLVLLESTSPSEVMLGQAFDYSMDVTNLTDCKLYEVTVTEDLVQNYELQASNPQAQVRGNTATWNLGELGARETKTVTARMLPQAAGEFEHCATVDYELRMCQTLLVVEPNLEITKSLPDNALVCDTIPMTIEVTNAGTGTVRDITVTDNLPNGLTTVDGQSTVKYSIASLSAGETQKRDIMLKASQTGNFDNTVMAESAGGLKAQASDSVQVRQPVLTISNTATDHQFAGRMIDYTIQVGNTGNAVARDVRVVDMLPSGVEFRSADNGGSYDQRANQIAWSIAAIQPGQNKTLKATVRAMQMGTQRNQAKAMATCADAVTAEAATKVQGVPAVLLEVIDVEDPIEVGETETYKITVTNQGTALDTNIRITCELEDSQSFVSAEGATAAAKTGQSVAFRPLAQLGAKEQAVWYVQVKAEKVDDVRFSVKMMTDELGNRPVEETEATNQY